MDIATLLDNVSHGAGRARVNEKIAELLDAIRDTGNGGQITLTIKLKPSGRYCEAIVDCKAKIPEEALPGQTFFFHKGRLHTDDPQQTSFAEVRNLESVQRSE